MVKLAEVEVKLRFRKKDLGSFLALSAVFFAIMDLLPAAIDIAFNTDLFRIGSNGSGLKWATELALPFLILSLVVNFFVILGWNVDRQQGYRD